MFVGVVPHRYQHHATLKCHNSHKHNQSFSTMPNTLLDVLPKVVKLFAIIIVGNPGKDGAAGDKGEKGNTGSQ